MSSRVLSDIRGILPWLGIVACAVGLPPSRSTWITTGTSLVLVLALVLVLRELAPLPRRRRAGQLRGCAGFVGSRCEEG